MSFVPRNTDLEYIAAAFNASSVTPLEAKNGLDGSKRFIGIYHNNPDGSVMLDAIARASEQDAVEKIARQIKEGIKITYEYGCMVKVTENNQGQKSNCWISALDKAEKDAMDARLNTIRADDIADNIWIAASFYQIGLTPEQAIANPDLRAIAFYQNELYGVARFVVTEKTAEEALKALIAQKGGKAIFIDYESGCNRRDIKYRIQNEREYKAKQCILAPLISEEAITIRIRWSQHQGRGSIPLL